MCERDENIQMTISLATTTVEGWVGTYYTVHHYNPTTSKESNYDFAGRGTAISGGMLEWGSLLEKKICLPPVPQCYEVCY